MASVVSICNLALAHFGQDGVVTDISPPDGTVEADYCAQFYPIARDEILERHAWRFATFRRALAVLATNELADQWAYAYSVPNLMLRALCVLPPQSTDDKEAVDFEIETQSDGTLVIYTDQENAVLKYIKQVDDPTKYTPNFVTALSFKLAQYISGPIAKRPDVTDKLSQQAEMYFLNAAALDARSRRKNFMRDHVPSHLQSRRV